MSTWYALCHGAGLRICDSCGRHVDRNQQAAASPHQSHIAPSTQGEKCSAWMAQRTPAITPTDHR